MILCKLYSILIHVNSGAEDLRDREYKLILNLQQSICRLLLSRTLVLGVINRGANLIKTHYRSETILLMIFECNHGRRVCKAHLGTCLGDKNWGAFFEAPRGTAKS